MTNPTTKNATMHLIEETLTAALKPMEGSVFKSVDSVVQSLEVPEAERATAAPGLSLAEIQAIAAELRRQQEAEAAARRARKTALAKARREAKKAARAA